MSPRRPPLRSPWLEALVAGVVATVLTFAAFAPGMRGAFVSDDVNAIVENEWVTGHFDPVGILTHFSWWSSGRADSPAFRPATTMTFAWSRMASGLDPAAFRIVNFVLHALCCALLFAVARRAGLGLEAAGAAAAVFAVLPIHSEAVLWIVGRAELGAAAAFLAVTLAALVHRADGSRLALATASATVAVGMAFKENAVTVAAVPLFAALAFGDRGRPRELRRDIEVLASIAAGIAAYALLRAGATGPPIAADPGSLLDNPLSVMEPVPRLLGAFAAFGRYVRLTLWPSPLSVDYSWDALGIGPGFVASADSAVAAVFLATSAAALWRGPGNRAVMALGLGMSAAAFSIVSNTVFVIGTILGERLFYLPTAGLALAAAAAAEPLFEAGRRASQRRVAALAATAALVAVAVAVDRDRAADWRTPVTLFESAVAAVPRSARAHMELASAYGQAGRVDEALRHFDASLAIKPDYTAAAYNRGNTLARAGRFAEAAEAYRRALAIDDRFVRAWHNLAMTEKLGGRHEAWAEAMTRAAALSPGSAVLQSELGEALLAVDRDEEAVRAYDAAIAAGAVDVSVFFNRAVALHRTGGCAAAVEDYRRAAAIAGAPPQARAFAVGCLKELGRHAEAAGLEGGGKVANRDTRR